MRTPFHSSVVVALALTALLSSTGLRAESVEDVPNPRTRGSWVTDNADVFTATDLTLLDATIDALEKHNGAEIAVVTVRTTAGKSPKAFAHELFNRWGVGKEGADNGVLLLLAKEDRRIEVETGYGAEGVLPDGKVGNILDAHAVPSFRRGDFGGGVGATVQALARELRKEEAAYSKAARKVGMTPRMAIVAMLFVAGLLVLGFLFWLSRRPKRCPTCNKQMRLLTEEQEDLYLDRDEQFEEHIKAHDWRVWRCDDDEENVIVAKGGWFSGYSECNACGRKTASTSSFTVRYPTYTSTGTERITTSCRLPRCKHISSHTRTLPMKVHTTSSSSSSSSGWSSSSSSSSSSFGGGSSGGGGAGRSW